MLDKLFPTASTHTTSWNNQPIQASPTCNRGAMVPSHVEKGAAKIF